jgi:uncharacterized protein (UPF0276 family)
MTIRASLPARAGVGLKAQHYDRIISGEPDVGWFEVHAENYMGAGGPVHYYLEKIRAEYALSIHGVGLSIGSDGPLDPDHLARLKIVVDRYQPEMVSEHLAWSSHNNVFFNDLLPLPYTAATQAKVCEHIDQLQNALGRTVLLENPSTYIGFNNNSLAETGFLSGVARQTGCGLLLDVNNVFVSATNHDYSPFDYICDFALDQVEEIHLAGHARAYDDDGHVLLIDSHDRTVTDEVWQLYRRTIQLTGPLPTLIEWDGDVPEWEVLYAEARTADKLLIDSTSRHSQTEPGHVAAC